MMMMSCNVIFRGQPFDGAEVVFEPEEFLGGSIEPAESLSSVSLNNLAPTLVELFGLDAADRPTTEPSVLPAKFVGGSFLAVRFCICPLPCGNCRVKHRNRK